MWTYWLPSFLWNVCIEMKLHVVKCGIQPYAPDATDAPAIARVVLGDPAHEPLIVSQELHVKLKSGMSLTQKVDVFWTAQMAGVF
jgi:hypothetical protein